MSKYEKLWNYFKDKNESTIILSLEEINNILGFKVDHSLLKYKKELIDYGYTIKKIKLKDKSIIFNKLL